MPQLTSFLQISLDGCFATADGDMSFAHKTDPEQKAFTAENAKGGGMLIFGRVTFEMMQHYWPTPLARENDPEVAERMTALPKLVFSRTLAKPTWKNTRVVKTSPAAELQKLKLEGKENMTILGSGSLVRELTAKNLIDRYDLMLVPVFLGDGKRFMSGLTTELDLELELTNTRTFKNGNVFLSYKPKRGR